LAALDVFVLATIMTLTITALPEPKKFFEQLGYSGPQADFGDLECAEWGAIFYDTLNCPVAIEEPTLPDESEEVWQERFSRKFQQAIPEYPKLGEIWNPSFYISYEPEEVEPLRSECQRVRALTSNESALSGLGKLLAACGEASKLGYGILLIPD
jgi:hypothetical protein